MDYTAGVAFASMISAFAETVWPGSFGTIAERGCLDRDFRCELFTNRVRYFFSITDAGVAVYFELLGDQPGSLVCLGTFEPTDANLIKLRSIVSGIEGILHLAGIRAHDALVLLGDIIASAQHREPIVQRRVERRKEG